MRDKDGNPIVTARLSFSNWVALVSLILGSGGAVAAGAFKLYADHEHRITVLETRAGIGRGAVGVLPLLLLCVLLGGCSAKAAISGAASAVQEAAHQTIEIVQPAADGGVLTRDDARTVVQLQRDIIGQAITVQSKVVKVQDEPGFLDRLGGMLKWLAIAAAVLVGVWFIAPAARPAFAVVGGWLAWLIPHRKKKAP